MVSYPLLRQRIRRTGSAMTIIVRGAERTGFTNTDIEPIKEGKQL